MITVLGSINLDLIGTVTRLPKPGETVPGGTFKTAAGGKGANSALAARRAGADVRMFGAVGIDTFADEALAELKAGGVDLRTVTGVPGPTGIAMILVDEHGENVIAVLPGANGTLKPADADAALEGLGAGDVLMLQQEIPQEATERALELASVQGVRAILNTAPFLDTTPQVARKAAIVIANETEFALLSGGSGALELASARGVTAILNTAPFLDTTPQVAREAAIVIANETEFALLSGGSGALEAKMQAWAKETGKTIVVTLGGDGARAATPETFVSAPALEIAPVDTVGAGDTFCGYLAAGLDKGLGLEEAMRRAAVAASLACLKPGAQPSIPMAAEVEAAVGR